MNQYVTMMLGALAVSGCSLTLDSLKQEAIQTVQEKVDEKIHAGTIKTNGLQREDRRWAVDEQRFITGRTQRITTYTEYGPIEGADPGATNPNPPIKPPAGPVNPQSLEFSPLNGPITGSLTQ